MNTDPEPSPGTPRRGDVRRRLLDAATALFYANGIRATSADRIIEEVGVSKVTFYRHFKTKDDLVVAYLQRRATWEREAVDAARAASKTPDEALGLMAQGIGAESCRPGFRGCPFINAAAEYPDPQHPVRVVVDEHRRWFRQAMIEVLRQVTDRDVSDAADELVILRDGAMVSGYLGDPQRIANALSAGFAAVIGSVRPTQSH